MTISPAQLTEPEGLLKRTESQMDTSGSYNDMHLQKDNRNMENNEIVPKAIENSIKSSTHMDDASLEMIKKKLISIMDEGTDENDREELEYNLDLFLKEVIDDEGLKQEFDWDEINGGTESVEYATGAGVLSSFETKQENDKAKTDKTVTKEETRTVGVKDSDEDDVNQIGYDNPFGDGFIQDGGISNNDQSEIQNKVEFKLGDNIKPTTEFRTDYVSEPYNLCQLPENARLTQCEKPVDGNMGYYLAALVFIIVVGVGGCALGLAHWFHQKRRAVETRRKSGKTKEEKVRLWQKGKHDNDEYTDDEFVGGYGGYGGYFDQDETLDTEKGRIERAVEVNRCMGIRNPNGPQSESMGIENEEAELGCTGDRLMKHPQTRFMSIVKSRIGVGEKYEDCSFSDECESLISYDELMGGVRVEGYNQDGTARMIQMVNVPAVETYEDVGKAVESTCGAAFIGLPRDGQLLPSMIEDTEKTMHSAITLRSFKSDGKIEESVKSGRSGMSKKSLLSSKTTKTDKTSTTVTSLWNRVFHSQMNGPEQYRCRISSVDFGTSCRSSKSSKSCISTNSDREEAESGYSMNSALSRTSSSSDEFTWGVGLWDTAGGGLAGQEAFGASSIPTRLIIGQEENLKSKTRDILALPENAAVVERRQHGQPEVTGYGPEHDRSSTVDSKTSYQTLYSTAPMYGSATSGSGKFGPDISTGIPGHGSTLKQVPSPAYTRPDRNGPER